MRKPLSIIFALFLALALVSPLAASVGVKVDGANQPVATDIHLTGAGSAVTTTGGELKFNLVLAGTSNGGATTMTTTDTAVSTSFSLVKKEIGVQVALAGTLANASPGQLLSILITERASPGTYQLIPTTTSGWHSITFDAREEYANLLFADATTGWIILSTNATINQNSTE